MARFSKSRLGAASLACAPLAVLAVAVGLPASAQDPGSTYMPAIAFPDRPNVPQVTPYPGLGMAYDYSGYRGQPAPIKVPDGFTPIFNGKDLTGWHISNTSRHGHTPDFHAMDGLLISTQKPVGGGGLLITDKKYKNYELYLEAKADWGADSGIFVRTTEDGSAYQVTLDYLPGGSMGTVISEGGLVGVGARAGAAPAAAGRGGAVAAPAGGRGGAAGPPAAAAAPAGGGRGGAPAAAGAAPAAPRVNQGMALWKPNDWNTVRVRVEGDIPHFTVWINGVETVNRQETTNAAVGGMITGPIALQVHGGPHRWQTGSFWRWRNIAIKELP